MKSKIINRLRTASNIQAETDLTSYFQLTASINHSHQSLQHLTDKQLKEKSFELKSRFGQTDILVEAYALVKEVIIRKLGITPFDVQLTGAIALFQNMLIEMQTGEGKTLTAVFPAFLNALSGKGVHILTFNDYLAKRDAQWMEPVYSFLGLSVGYIQEGMDREEKRKAYHCDITYATAKEVGFDYLRSFIAYHKQDIVLRPFHYAIIDEADALMIDEARNPLVLAGDIISSDIDFKKMAALVGSLENETDFDTDAYSRNIFLTEEGIDKMEQALQVNNLQDEVHHELLSAINLALHARMLLHRDVDYVIRNHEIKLVDEFTGRIVEDRKWRNGLQTAVEAKEGLHIQSEGNILNSISLQHFIHQYPHIAGMTATAANDAEEFHDFYGLKVLCIPPNKQCLRKDHPDIICTHKEAKYQAVLKEVKSLRQKGQPVLIGTLTVKESETLADLFKNQGIHCHVLNAKNDALEAEIIAEAGKKGAVTISTNMAGRGTDILLGGRDGKEKNEVVNAGGLYVIGTNRHESKRIDNQLRGRAARQGDIGESRFFVSLEDDLMLRYRLKEALPKNYQNLNSNDPINSKYLTRYFDHIQRVIEGQSFDMRKTLLEYSDMVETQRQIIQYERQEILLQPSLFYEKFPKAQTGNPELNEKIMEAILFQYDKHWTLHLDYLQQVRDSIHLVRIGGQNPLREMKKNADDSFKELGKNLVQDIETMVDRLSNDQNITLKDLGIRKPSSTWTYMINDNPFGNKLSTMLLDNSNIGFQADPLSAMMLAVYGIMERFKRSKKKDV